MKLRIRGNSLRLRVSQTELTRIAEHGAVSETIDFGAEARLTYGIEIRSGARLRASFENDEIRVIVPDTALERWLEPAEVSIIGEQALGHGATLKILIEKDFVCLSPREGEDDADLFPNPALAQR